MQILTSSSFLIPSHFQIFKSAIINLIYNQKFSIFVDENPSYSDKDIDIIVDIIKKAQSLKIEILPEYKNHIKIFDFLFEINQIFINANDEINGDIIIKDEIIFAIKIKDKIKIKNNVVIIDFNNNHQIIKAFSEIHILQYKNNESDKIIILTRNFQNQVVFNFENIIIYTINDLHNNIKIYYFVKWVALYFLTKKKK